MIFSFRDLDKTEASLLFDKEAQLTIPTKFKENPYADPLDSTGEADALVGEIYSELRKILSHYYEFFKQNSEEFKAWYNSGDFEMNDDTKIKILNILLVHVKSIKDLEPFWLFTEGPFLKGRLASISSGIRKLQAIINSQSPTYNKIEDTALFSTIPPEKRNIWLMNKAIYIVENFRAGLNNYEGNDHTHVLKNFLTGVVEKKKLDKILGTLILSL
ncbi:spore wall protein 26 [Vairimorpha necatrix]|uniref:Spore wall protein 26 n=1 Tax=Vairimorpha necatrix TaxID=6039 RepID=A0AAX4JC04_9MICR